MTLPKPRICWRAILWSGCDFRPGYQTFSILGCASKHAGDGEAGAVVMFHAERETFQSAFEQEAGERSRRGADHALHLV